MIKFKFNNCLLISLLLISVSNAFQITSDADINFAGGYVTVEFYYDDVEKVMGYKFTEPINMKVLYDYKNHVMYKHGNYIDKSDHYVDYFKFNNTKRTVNINENNINNELSNSKDFYKYEKRYYYDNFPLIDSTYHNDGDAIYTEYIKFPNKNINRPYIGNKEKIMIYKGDKDSNIEYLCYSINYNIPLEFKLKDRDLTFVLKNAKRTNINIKEEFGVYSYNFSTTVTKCNSEIDIVFLLDESENIAEQEFNKIINFCKLNVIQYSLDYNKARFAIVGYGSYGVLHLDFTNSISDIMTTLDKLKAQQIRGKTCLGCGLSIAEGVFKNGRSGVQQMLINIMASAVNQPTYSGNCTKENQTTYHDYCIGECNKLEYDYCTEPIEKEVKIKEKVFTFNQKRDETDCQCKNYNNNGYHCSDCSCDESKHHIVCKECTLEAKYGFKRCSNKIQKLGCKSDNTITFYDNYTSTKDQFLKNNNKIIIVNIGIGKETYSQVNQLSTLNLAIKKERIQTNYLFSSFDQFNDISSITNFTSYISKLLYNYDNYECGKHCRGVCGLNGQCYCPTKCIEDTNDKTTYTVCITDDKNLTVSGCEKVIKKCLPPLTEDGIPNMCYKATYNNKTKKCEYELKPIETNEDPCKINICDPRDGSTHTLNNTLYCSIPEDIFNEEMKIDDNVINVDITFKLKDPCKRAGDKCYVASYETICKSKSIYYDCFGIDGKCECILNDKGKKCTDILDTENKKYSQAIINNNECTYEEYENCNEDDKCTYICYKTSDITKTKTVKPNVCDLQKPNNVTVYVGGPDNKHIQVLKTYKYNSECKVSSSTPTICLEAVFDVEECKSIDPAYICEPDDTKTSGCKCVERTGNDKCPEFINSYDAISGHHDQCYWTEYDSDSGYCRHGFNNLYYKTQTDSFYICQNYTTKRDDPSIIKAPVNIYSMNGENTRFLGSIDEYTFGGYVNMQYNKDNILTYVGYEKIGKIVYNEYNEPVLSVNKIKVPIPDVQWNKDYVCSNNDCIKYREIPDNTRYFNYYSMTFYNKMYPNETQKISNEYYHLKSGISISEIQPYDHPFGDHEDCISTDKCYIGFETYDGRCLQSKLILPDTNDTECFEYICEDGKLIQKPLYNQFTLINSPCVKKYGDKLNMFNGRVWYYHLTRYVSRLIDVLFVLTVVVIIVISFGVGIVVNFIRLKNIKSYIQLDNNEDIELEDTVNMAK